MPIRSRGAGAADPSWTKVYEQSFEGGDFLGHSLKDDGDIVVDGVTYSNRNASATTDLVFGATGLSHQLPNGCGLAGVSFDLIPAQYGDAFTDKTRLAIQWRYDSAPVSGMQGASWLGTGNDFFFQGLSGAAGTPGGFSGRQYGASSYSIKDGTGSYPSVDFVEQVVNLYGETSELWFGTWGGAWPTPRTETYYSVASLGDTQPAQTTLPVPRLWSGSLDSLNVKLTFANYTGGAVTRLTKGYAIWRSED